MPAVWTTWLEKITVVVYSPAAAGAPQSSAPSLPDSGGTQQGVPENDSSFPELETLVSSGQRFSLAGTEDGAYVRLTREDHSEVLAFIDYKAQTGVPLCSQANCTHSDNACTAWIPNGWNNVFVWDVQGEGLNISVERENSKEDPDWYLYRDSTLLPSQYATVGETDPQAKKRVVADAGDWCLVQRDYTDSNP